MLKPWPPFGEGVVVTNVLIAGDLSRIVENIAWGITERIRTGRNSTLTNGVADHPETYIHVNWPSSNNAPLASIEALAIKLCLAG
ncbi:hypothetical protein N7447_002934 [Penicillium robsamsonii]|uniref:uncharacterized protein n=1 Tax=Penicillium robsamsonii TaxID=1792511 RepID=UPI0025490719|nr:uncharacterized protein N7447_002934 [Penicillium robsamsonii]KAJ5836908.1 hypothetical protein N7447_002934 [Penicillium robsamsonii]